MAPNSRRQPISTHTQEFIALPVMVALRRTKVCLPLAKRSERDGDTMFPQSPDTNRIPDACASEVAVEFVLLQPAPSIMLLPDVLRRGRGPSCNFNRPHNSLGGSGCVDNAQVSRSEPRLSPPQFDSFSSGEYCIHESRS